MREWATTEAELREDYYDDDYRPQRDTLTPQPVPPKGIGWDLKAAVVHGNRVLWFWQRE